MKKDSIDSGFPTFDFRDAPKKESFWADVQMVPIYGCSTSGFKDEDDEYPGFDGRKTGYDVVIENSGPNRIEVIRTIRQLTSLGLKEAKDLTDSAPVILMEEVSWQKANVVKAKLEGAGAVVIIR